MKELVIHDTTVRLDNAGRYNLNDLHIASGGDKRHQPANFLRLDTTGELTKILDAEGPRAQPVETAVGRYGGTYVCRELVYAYAMWISPAFHLRVLRILDEVARTGAYGSPLPPPLRFIRAEDLLSAVNDASAKGQRRLTPSRLRRAANELSLLRRFGGEFPIVGSQVPGGWYVIAVEAVPYLCASLGLLYRHQQEAVAALVKDETRRLGVQEVQALAAPGELEGVERDLLRLATFNEQPNNHPRIGEGPQQETL